MNSIKYLMIMNLKVKMCLVAFFALTISCDTNDDSNNNGKLVFERFADTPIYRDLIPEENYQSASDPHVFYNGNDLKMVYSGDVNGNSAIKLATGTSWSEWTFTAPLLFETGPSGMDVQKETAFYRKTANGKHQIYYIGYDDETTYQAEIYLAEADALTGPYTQMTSPVVPRGNIAGKEVYCITSPSVVEHNGLLYITFIGWNASPNAVTEVWMLGATSVDDGHTWSDFQVVDTKIGMEGQVTKAPDGTFVAVRTAEYNNKEAIFYATASHPFGPWEEEEVPILVQSDLPAEKDEVIAPQITFDALTGKQYLYYTGADHDLGWWIMLAKQK